MFQFLYTLLVESGFLYYLVPIFKRCFIWFINPKKISNYQSVDKSGAKIYLTKKGGKLYPAVGEKQLSKIKDLRIRKDDVMICGYPKTGCHWLFEIVHMIIHQSAKLSPHGKDFGGMIDLLPEILVDSIPSPRILNSHLAYDELPTQIKPYKTKLILSVRSPKDVVVSFYHHHSKIVKHAYFYDGQFPDYVPLFMSGHLDYGSYFDYYQDWDKVMRSNPDNEIFVMEFESLKKDPVAMVKKLADFLEREVSDLLAVQIAEATTFKNMKKGRESDPSQSGFLRKGEVSDWKNWLTEEQAEAIDRKWNDVTRQRLHLEFS